MVDFALLNPGAGWGAKQWPAERYGQVARRLAEDGVKSLINFGPGEEPLMRAVESASGDTAKGMACSLTELVALTRRARLFIGGAGSLQQCCADTGETIILDDRHGASSGLPHTVQTNTQCPSWQHLWLTPTRRPRSRNDGMNFSTATRSSARLPI